MKILFLDIDGVLNSDKWWKSQGFLDRCGEYRKRGFYEYKNYAAFCPDMVQKLNRIFEETSCRIVLSTAWRHSHSIEEIAEFLTEAGFLYSDIIIDKTPDLEYKSYDPSAKYNEVLASYKGRGSEIREWLDEHKDEVDSFAVLDDQDDMDGVREGFVRTKWRHGLSDENVSKVIELLNKVG